MYSLSMDTASSSKTLCISIATETVDMGIERARTIYACTLAHYPLHFMATTQGNNSGCEDAQSYPDVKTAHRELSEHDLSADMTSSLKTLCISIATA